MSAPRTCDCGQRDRGGHKRHCGLVTDALRRAARTRGERRYLLEAKADGTQRVLRLLAETGPRFTPASRGGPVWVHEDLLDVTRERMPGADVRVMGSP